MSVWARLSIFLVVFLAAPQSAWAADASTAWMTNPRTNRPTPNFVVPQAYETASRQAELS